MTASSYLQVSLRSANLHGGLSRWLLTTGLNLCASGVVTLGSWSRGFLCALRSFGLQETVTSVSLAKFFHTGGSDLVVAGQRGDSQLKIGGVVALNGHLRRRGNDGQLSGADGQLKEG